jgi:hypothetical protein
MRLLFTLLSLLCISRSISAKTFDINSYGAEPDGKTLSTFAIQKTINACGKGDTVLVPYGRYVTGTLHLKSNITILIEKEAYLLGSPNLKDYESYSTAGNGLCYYGILFTADAINVAIIGKGVIEGNSNVFLDFGKTGNMDTALTRYARQRSAYRKLPVTASDEPVIALDRPQHMLAFVNCKNVLIQNISLLNAPYRALCFVGCEGVKATGLKIWSNLNIPDAAGIAISNSKNMFINGCDVRSGNDAIAIAGYNPQLQVPGAGVAIDISENIKLTNSNLQASSSGISISALTAGSVKNVHVSQVTITDTNRGIGLVLRDEGSLEQMTFSDMYIETRLRTGNWVGNGEPVHISAVRGKEHVKLGSINDISFSNIACTGENHMLLYGCKESLVKDIRFDDIVFKLKNSSLNEVAGGNINLQGSIYPQENLFASTIPAVMARYIAGLTINNIKISWANTITQPYFTNGIEVSNFKSFKLTGYIIKAAPASKGAHSVYLSDGVLAMVEPGDVNKTRVISSQTAKINLKPDKKKVVLQR